MHNFRELKVWKKARHLVKDIYLLTKDLPDKEKFGLISQMRRASVSILQTLQKEQEEEQIKNSHDFWIFPLAQHLS